LASALENYGAEIIDAENGANALKILEKQCIDIVLIDIMMSVMDGFETIKAIRRKDELKELPIIAITAKSLKGDRESCIAAGANDYISKPVDYDTLIHLVKAWIERELKNKERAMAVHLQFDRAGMNTTEFFRDPEVFQELKLKLLPLLEERIININKAKINQ